MNFKAEVESTDVNPVLLNYGGAEKSLDEMNEEEVNTAAKVILNRAKEKAFSKGLPIYYMLSKQLVAEYADGRIVPVNA